MRTIVFRTNIDILTCFHAVSSLRIFHILYFPHSPISRFRTPIPPSQKCDAVAPPSLPPPLPSRKEKKNNVMTFIVLPTRLGRVLFSNVFLLCLGVIWPLQDIIDGSFSNCYTSHFKTLHNSIFSRIPNIDIPHIDSAKTQT